MRVILVILSIILYLTQSESSSLHKKQHIDNISIKYITAKDLADSLKKEYLDARSNWEKKENKANAARMNILWRRYNKYRDSKGSIVTVYYVGEKKRFLSVSGTSKRGDKREWLLIDVEDSATVNFSFEPYRIEIKDHIRKETAEYIVE